MNVETKVLSMSVTFSELNEQFCHDTGNIKHYKQVLYPTLHTMQSPIQYKKQLLGYCDLHCQFGQARPYASFFFISSAVPTLSSTTSYTIAVSYTHLTLPTIYSV